MGVSVSVSVMVLVGVTVNVSVKVFVGVLVLVFVNNQYFNTYLYTDTATTAFTDIYCYLNSDNLIDFYFDSYTNQYSYINTHTNSNPWWVRRCF